MNREYHRWHSPALGRDMELLVFGHAGARVLVYPTSLGKFFEWEDRDMTGALHEGLERGWFQLYCVDSVDAESWYARDRHPAHAVQRHEAYEAYVIDEVLPFSLHRNPHPFLITTGASFGAYHALNFAFRHPHLVGRVLGMSGLYDIRRMTGGHEGSGVYAHNPSHYMTEMPDGAHLEAIRRVDVILAIGKDDPNRANNEHVSSVLWSRGVWHAFRLWDGWAHDWPWWRQMVAAYIGGHD